jgi:hypothetical protein
VLLRIWDVEPSRLCRQHLLGEHRELHGLWNILTRHGGTGGYSAHPETRRWVGKLAALHARHLALAEEMARRGYDHRSPLDEALATGSATQGEYVDTPDAQRAILVAKGCACEAIG